MVYPVEIERTQLLIIELENECVRAWKKGFVSFDVASEAVDALNDLYPEWS
jgi:hypothetical protein